MQQEQEVLGSGAGDLTPPLCPRGGMGMFAGRNHPHIPGFVGCLWPPELAWETQKGFWDGGVTKGGGTVPPREGDKPFVTGQSDFCHSFGARVS